MSTHIKHILVAIGTLKRPPTFELRKAAALARAAGASVELFHAIEEPDPAVAYPQTSTSKAVEQRRAAVIAKSCARLELFARKVLAGVETTCTAEWAHPPYEAIVRRVLATRADLVVAGARGHRFGARLLLRNTDWELIRHCPVPLLLVKSSRPYVEPVIVAALDPFHAHARPADLDGRLLSAASHFAQLLHGTVHVFHAYMPVLNVEPLSVVPLTVLPREAEETHREEIAGVIREMATSGGIPESRCHVKMGDVVAQLSATTQRTRAGLVVMGAVSRTALARLFVGNTAERALDRLSCDVLVIKPRGFAAQATRTSPGRPARRSRTAEIRALASLHPRAETMPIPPLF